MTVFGKVLVSKREIAQLKEYRDNEKKRYLASTVARVRKEDEEQYNALREEFRSERRNLENQIADLNEELDKTCEQLRDQKALDKLEKELLNREADTTARENNIEDRIKAAVAEAREEIATKYLDRNDGIISDIIHHGEKLLALPEHVTVNQAPRTGLNYAVGVDMGTTGGSLYR